MFLAVWNTSKIFPKIDRSKIYSIKGEDIGIKFLVFGKKQQYGKIETALPIHFFAIAIYWSNSEIKIMRKYRFFSRADFP